MKNKRKILDVLKQNKLLSESFESWLQKIVVGMDDLEIMFEENLENASKELVKKNLKMDAKHLPFRAFVEKKNTVYVFVKNKDLTSEWRILSLDDVERINYALSKRFLTRFIEWQNLHREEIDSCEKMKDLHMEYMMKLNGGKKSQERLNSDMKLFIYQKIAAHLETIYEDDS